MSYDLHVHCTPYNVRCTLYKYNVLSTCTTYIVRRTVYDVQCTSYTVRVLLMLYNVRHQRI